MRGRKKAARAWPATALPRAFRCESSLWNKCRIPSLPTGVPVLRISGWMAGPADGSQLTARMRERIRDHKGPLYLLGSSFERDGARKDAASYGLAIASEGCQTLSTNLTTPLSGTYELCPLMRQ